MPKFIGYSPRSLKKGFRSSHLPIRVSHRSLPATKQLSLKPIRLMIIFQTFDNFEEGLVMFGSNRLKRNHVISITILIYAFLISWAENTQAIPAPNANSVLILDTAVTGGASSVEATKAAANGLTPVVVDAATWGATSAAEFAGFRAIVLGDPTCGAFGTSPWLDAAIANRGTWGPVINGNVVLVGTDAVFHQFQGGDQLTESGIKFAANEPAKTGAYITLSCYYHDTAEGTPVTLLDVFGGFTVKGVGCFNDVHLVASHPALAGTTDATLSNWSCSVHEAFDAFPPTFLPLAIAQGAAGSGVLAFPDGSSGIPYVIARGEDLVPVACGDGKIDPGEQCDDGNTANGDGCSAQCQIEEVTNVAPDCSLAAASRVTLWPPNHQMVPESISGITDGNGDPIAITVTGIMQDEPLIGAGTGNFSPDAIINADGSFSLRAERKGSAPHNGRVYSIDVQASDPSGATCSATVHVCVPHDQGNKSVCIDDGATEDSTVTVSKKK